MEIHNFEDFLSDKYNHILGATYEKLDASRFSKQFSMKKVTDLPKISPNDAPIKYLGYKEGDVVKITTLNEISGVSIAYKHVG